MIVEFKIPILGAKVWIWIAVQLRGFIAIAYTRSKNATCVCIYIYIYMAKGKRMQMDQWPKNLTTFSLITPPLKSNISQTLWPWYPNYGHQKEFYYISYYNLSHLCLFITLNNWWIFMCYGFLYHCFSFLMHRAKIGKLKSNFIAQPSSKVRNLIFYHLRKVKPKIDIKEVDSKLIAFPSLIKLEIIQMSF